MDMRKCVRSTGCLLRDVRPMTEEGASGYSCLVCRPWSCLQGAVVAHCPAQITVDGACTHTLLTPRSPCRYCYRSDKSDSLRTVQGFSTEAGVKLTGEEWYDMWVAYWGSDDYADVFTSSACEGTGDFSGTSVETRSEGCLKGAQ